MLVPVCAWKRHPRPRQWGQARSLQVREIPGILINLAGVKGQSANTGGWTKDAKMNEGGV